MSLKFHPDTMACDRCQHETLIERPAKGKDELVSIIRDLVERLEVHLSYVPDDMKDCLAIRNMDRPLIERARKAIEP
jgi:hypothetical protein